MSRYDFEATPAWDNLSYNTRLGDESDHSELATAALTLRRSAALRAGLRVRLLGGMGAGLFFSLGSKRTEIRLARRGAWGHQRRCAPGEYRLIAGHYQGSIAGLAGSFSCRKSVISPYRCRLVFAFSSIE